MKLVRALLLALALAPVAASSTPALAADESPSPFTVEVVLVRGSREGTGIDPSLAPFQRDLQALPYTRFTRVGGEAWPARAGASGSATVGGVSVTVEVTASAPEGVTATVTATRGGKTVARTSFSRPWGRAHVVSLGAEGDAILLLPVRVTR
jgi:hypothetical protein